MMSNATCVGRSSTLIFIKKNKFQVQQKKIKLKWNVLLPQRKPPPHLLLRTMRSTVFSIWNVPSAQVNTGVSSTSASSLIIQIFKVIDALWQILLRSKFSYLHAHLPARTTLLHFHLHCCIRTGRWFGYNNAHLFLISLHKQMFIDNKSTNTETSLCCCSIAKT